MAKKLMRDSVSGKLMRDEATGKLQTTILCANSMKVTLALVVDCYPEGACPWPSDINGVHILNALGGGCKTAFIKTFSLWKLLLYIDEGWIRCAIREGDPPCWDGYSQYTAFTACFTPFTWDANNVANEITCVEGECGTKDCNGNLFVCGAVIGESGTADWEINS